MLKKILGEAQKRKIASIKIIKLQSDTGSDIVINADMWRKIGKLILKETSRIAQGVSKKNCVLWVK